MRSGWGLVVCCLVVGLLAGCGGGSTTRATTSTTGGTGDTWFEMRPVVEVSPPPCTGDTTPSEERTECYRLGGRLVGPSGIVLAKAVEGVSVPEGCPEGQKVCYVPGSPSTASAPALASWSVALTLSGEALDAFNAVAATCFERTSPAPSGQIAMVLDGTVVAAPTIQQSRYSADQFQVGGPFTEAQARDLAARFG